jgi:hypothetical protein
MILRLRVIGGFRSFGQILLEVAVREDDLPELILWKYLAYHRNLCRPCFT